MWIWQANVGIPADWWVGVEVIGAVAAGYGIFVVSWVAWNRSIYRRRHRRTEPLQLEVAFTTDTLGRTIVAGPGVAAYPVEVVVSVSADDRSKLYDAVAA